MPRIHPRRAFSLVEIALALGIAAFALTAILGLFSIGVHSGKESANDTLLAAMTNTIVNGMRRQVFYDPVDAKAMADLGKEYVYLVGTEPVNNGVTPTMTPIRNRDNTVAVRYFDASGVEMADANHYPPNSTGTNPFGQAAYGCIVSTLADINTLGPPDYNNANKRTVNLLLVQLAFAWPPNATVATNKRTINVSVARY